VKKQAQRLNLLEGLVFSTVPGGLKKHIIAVAKPPHGQFRGLPCMTLQSMAIRLVQFTKTACVQSASATISNA
jgi:uncharacterized protein YjeT (DUF2065 family)